jgi:hypothetical protein
MHRSQGGDGGSRAVVVSTSCLFDEKELAELHAEATNYDYREYAFRLLPRGDWFRSS